MSKIKPKLHGGAVLIKNTPEEQVVEVRRLALEFCKHVPVVILANDLATATRLYSTCFEGVGPEEVGTVQLFLELDPASGKKTDYAAVLKEATRPMPSSTSPSGFLWPITVSDPFGGRGQDYTVLKKEVDNAGGIMVICTAIPDSEREWTQWLGRTARSDRKGQYAVVLEHTAPLLQAVKPEVLRLHQLGVLPGTYRDTVIGALLDERDKAIKAKLDEMAPELALGKRLHELCYAFWCKQEGGCNVALWPANDKQKKLRAFLERMPLWSESVAFGKAAGMRTDNLAQEEKLALQTKCSAATVFGPDSVAAFAVEVGLASSSEEYKRKSDYCM
jgi:hypothetical protein